MADQTLNKKKVEQSQKKRKLNEEEEEKKKNHEQIKKQSLKRKNDLHSDDDDVADNQCEQGEYIEDSPIISQGMEHEDGYENVDSYFDRKMLDILNKSPKFKIQGAKINHYKFWLPEGKQTHGIIFSSMLTDSVFTMGTSVVQPISKESKSILFTGMICYNPKKAQYCVVSKAANFFNDISVEDSAYILKICQNEMTQNKK